MLPCVCSVIDHRRRQNAVKTSVTHSAIASCATLLFLPHFHVICNLLVNRHRATWNLFVNQILKRLRFTLYALRIRRWPFASQYGTRFSEYWTMLADWTTIVNKTFTVFFLTEKNTVANAENPYNCGTDENCPPSSFCKEWRCYCREELIGDGENCRARKKVFRSLYRRIFTDVIVSNFAH